MSVKFSILILMLIPVRLFSQKVYSVDYLKVFKVDYPNQSNGNNGLWYFVDYPNQSDKKIYFVDYPNQSDLKIFFVKYQNQSGWRDKSKQHLMYWLPLSGTHLLPPNILPFKIINFWFLSYLLRFIYSSFINVSIEVRTSYISFIWGYLNHW